MTCIVTVNVSIGPLLSQVTQCYISWPSRQWPSTPKLQLVGFQRLTVKAQESVQVAFDLKQEQLQLWDADLHRFVVHPGWCTDSFSDQFQCIHSI